MPDLLIELFSEEIPARMQRRAADDLRRLVTDGLVEAGLTYAGAAAHVTPRRLALAVEGFTDRSPTTTETRRGPRVDAPEKALDGFLRSTGLTREQLEEQDDKKGRVYIATLTKPGRPAADIVAEVLEAAIRDFPWPKSMRWGNDALRWVRPLRSILCILTREDGAEIVPLDVDGIVAGDTTEGHRFMAPTPFRVSSFDDYEAKLKRAFVVLSSEERAEAIRQDAASLAFAAGLEVVEDPGLLAEVAGLVEWPVTLMGKIGADFLDLPPEVLQTSMREHQKFFSVRDKTGRITHFITVANRETADDGATILAGNNRVLSARLSDAKFFWENDLRVARGSIYDWLLRFTNVTFHKDLGNELYHIGRLGDLSEKIAKEIGADAEISKAAAIFSKADLSSEMVGEFPELQGLMGSYYLRENGQLDIVARAAIEHRRPLGPDDIVPSDPVIVSVALADKIDLLCGFWSIDEKPTGSKDPFALRRAALGIIRIISNARLKLSLKTFIFDSIAGFLTNADIVGQLHDMAEIEKTLKSSNHENPNEVMQLISKNVRRRLGGKQIRDNATSMTNNLLSFLHDRLKQHLRTENIRHDVIDAVLTGDRTDDLADVTARARALNAFLATDNGENLIQGYKRAKNILDQAEAKDGVEYSYGADPKLADTDEERALFAALAAARPQIDAALAAEDYPAAMTALAALRAPIDAFVEAVQVNVDSEVVRRNRLNMLSEIVRTGAKIADLTRIGA